MGQKHHSIKRHISRNKKMMNVMPETDLPQTETPVVEPKKNWFSLFKQPKIFIPVVILILLYIAFNVWIYFYGTKVFGKKQTAFSNFATNMALVKPAGFKSSFIATPTPRPPITPKPILSGRQEYTFSHGKAVTGPKPLKVILDPQTPDPDQVQTFTVTIKNNSPVTSAKVNVITDNKKTTYPLTLISGTNQNGTWQGSWKLQDTYIYDYYLQFDLQSTTGNYNEGIRLRQSPI